MGSRRKQRLLLEVAATDSTFELKERDGEQVLQGKCIHCQRKLALRTDGTPINGATIEHIVPKNHGGTDDLENLAIACARCNSEKGLRHDHKQPDDPKLLEVVERLRERRRKRYRPTKPHAP
ncbi:MAG: HNH endonuclease [Myxococcales bacterium]|nr:MAG: HNH endonuclease [Myxococcales bacterium]